MSKFGLLVVVAFLLAIFATVGVRLAQAQANGALVTAPGVVSATWQSVPGAVPTTAADLCAQTFYAKEIILTNTTASTAVTVTIQTKQATPVVLFTAIIPGLATNPNYVIASYPDGLQFPGGVTWVASTTGVNGYVRGGF